MLKNTIEKLMFKYDDQDEKHNDTGDAERFVVRNSNINFESYDTDHMVDRCHDSSHNLNHWKQSEPVVMLSAFLKEYNDQGFNLQQTKDGIAVLSYEPGLKDQDQDQERWDLAMHVSYLMDKAEKDLNKLIFKGYLTLPEYTGIWL